MEVKTPVPRVGTGVFIFKPDERFLLIQRKKGCGKGKWTVPGGKIEYGETVEQTGKREVFEETGLRPAFLVPVTVTSSICEECPEHWITVWMTSLWNGDEPRLTDEVSDFVWCSLSDLHNNLWNPHWVLLQKTAFWKQLRSGF